MTQISYIHGIGANERRDRAQEIPSQSYINYTTLTDGELRLTLLADQVNMLAAYFPENKDLQKAKNTLVDALYKGVHRSPLPGGIHTGIMATVVKEMRFARENTQPAAGKIYGRENGISGGINDPLIPYEDCFWNPFTASYTDPDCPRRNEIKKILNENLEKSGHHILYEFVQNPNTSPATVAAKTVNHRAAKSTIAKIAEIRESNMKLWLRNGVIRNNAVKGAGTMQPEDTIKTLKENAGKGIGNPAVLVAIITAIAAAISAAAQLVATLKQKDPQQAALWNQFQGIGTGAFGPENGDWQLGGNGATTEETDFLPILLAAGAGLLLID